jgi:alpha-tubulin suppressor-like RCC1 family protein
MVRSLSMRSRLVSWAFVSSALPAIVMAGACSLQEGGTAQPEAAPDGAPVVVPEADAAAQPDAVAPDAHVIPDAAVTPIFVQVSAGPSRACGVTSLGGVECWGSGVLGGNGDGTTNNRAAPVDVSDLTDAKSVAVGRNHTCAVTVSGAVECWGANSLGQLGDGSSTQRTTPTPTTGLASGVASLAAGDNHTCALSDAGGVKCWGANASGQLGDGSKVNPSSPVDVNGLTSGVAAIAAGEAHTCALTTAGGVKCWGKNDVGQLGDNTTADKTAPVGVQGLASGVVAIGAGASHTCAVLASGAVRCWGLNTTGQLGDDSTTNRSAPADVIGLAGPVAAISGGAAHTCAQMESGGVSCWGNNAFRELADGTITFRTKPVTTNTGSPGDVISSLDAGGYTTCAIVPASGKLRCWGRPDDGQLGDGKAFLVRATAAPALGSGATSIAAGPHRACAIEAAAAVTCWGDSVEAADVPGLGSVAAISVGSGTTCILVGSGIQCWGANAHGQLGDDTTTATQSPTGVSGLASGVSNVSAGGEFTCARTSSGGAKCWGKNDVGQLGDNSKTDRHTPVDVSGLTSSVVAIETGSQGVTCAIVVGGGVKCWGNGGQTPVDIAGVTGATAISVGLGHACAIVAGGAVQCWGKNGDGELGDGTFVTGASPVAVSGLSGAIAIGAGDAQTCAIVTGGGVKCWGANYGGQLGDGTTQVRSTPVDVLGVSDATALAVGGTFACAIETGGAIACWGRGDYCQLGACVSHGPVDVAWP